jgi:hypothetical protein
MTAGSSRIASFLALVRIIVVMDADIADSSYG